MATVDLEAKRPVPAPLRRVSRKSAALGAPAETPEVGHAAAHSESSKRQDILHSLLFIIEYSGSMDPRWQDHRRHLSLFFSRHGGLHLLLMLLNAYYNKPVAGRRPGWVFSGLRDRIQISERGLRMLINDAMADGLIEQQPISQELDRRCRSYRLTPKVVIAWEALMEALHKSIGGVLEQFDAGALANVDYRRWNTDLPAGDQIDRLPPSHRLRRRA